MSNEIQGILVQELAQKLRKSIDNSIVWDLVKLNHEGWTEVCIPWETHNRPTPWNEVCAWALEEFGLPESEMLK